MKFKLASLGVLVVASFGFPVHAGGTHNLGVSATVNATCNFNSPGGTTAVTIGNSGGAIDPSLSTDATGTANVLFRCTSGTTSAISADNGANFSGSRRVGTGGNFMPYDLALAGNAQAGSGFGAGQDKTLGVTATITAANYQNAPAGTYTDTVVLTITP